MYLYIGWLIGWLVGWLIDWLIPVVPHKAVAEAANIRNYGRGELLWWMDGGGNPVMDRKVAEALSLALSLSLILSVTFSLCLSICPSVYLYVYLSVV